MRGASPRREDRTGLRETVLHARNLVTGEVLLVADARTNRILIITRPENFRYLTGLIKEFDVVTKLSDPVEVRLRYISVSDALPLLQNMLAEDASEAGSSGGGRAAPVAAAAAAGGNSLDKPDMLTGGSADTAPVSVLIGKTRLVGDKTANTILVLGPPENLAKVRKIIAQLDQRPMQVYISTVIGQYTLNDNMEFGVDVLQKFSRLGREGGIASASRTRGAGDVIVDPSSLISTPGFPLPAGLAAYATFGRTLDVFVKALAGDDKFKVIARPVLFTDNNKKATITSGQSIAVPTSTLSSLTTGSSNASAVSASIDFKQVVLKLEVLPLVNSDKEVTLQIAQQNDTIVGSTSISGNTVPTIGTQEINITVRVPNRQTVVLGGLINESKSESENGVPFLKDIPLLGYFFKDRIKTNRRTMLIILMQATVIATDEDFAAAQRGETDRVAGSDELKRFADPPPLKLREVEEEDDEDEN